MIYITGDTHSPIDIGKLSTKVFTAQKNLTKNDFVIIAGDCGVVWDGSKTDKYWQQWLNEKNFTTMFVDGNHENFPLLNDFPVEERFGGMVHVVAPSVYHLMRGEVFNIDGMRIFCMGGASSHDKMRRVEGVSWWPEEIPSIAEMEHAIKNLELNNWSVDYIITHCAPKSTMMQLSPWYENDALTIFLGAVDSRCSYKHWYFGHYHVDRHIDEKHTALYDSICQIGGAGCAG